MAKVTRQQIESLWTQAGGNPQNASTASAIAMAESGGDTDSKNDRNSNGTIDRGLWQINSVHGSLSSFDPLANARAAVSISSNGSNWKPWCVAWSNGACGGTFMGPGSPVLKFLGLDDANTVQTAAANAGGSFQSASLPSVTDPKAWTDAVLQPIGVWLYAGMLFAVGAGMFGLGVWLLFRETQIGSAIESKLLSTGDAALPGKPLQTVVEPGGPPASVPASQPAAKQLPGKTPDTDTSDMRARRFVRAQMRKRGKGNDA
jgi:Lysozyme like domain